MSTISLSLAGTVRLMAVLFCSGIFWMMVLYLVEKPDLDRPRPGSVPMAIAILLVAAFLLTIVVTRADAVAFLVPPTE